MMGWNEAVRRISNGEDMLVRLYGDVPGPAGRYNPVECTDAIKTRIEGDPDAKHVSTSYAERQNLTMRMSMRRFTRLTNAFFQED